MVFMKKSVLVAFLIFSVLVVLPLFAQALTTQEQQAMNNATIFIKSTVNYCSPPPSSGSGSTLEDQVYTALATGLCSDQIISAQQPSGCFPSDYLGLCNVQRTAQAALALYMTNPSGYSAQINNATRWLSEQNITSPNVQWYLQLDSNSPITCSVTDSEGKILNIAMDSNKKLTTGTGSTSTCLGISSNSYWVKPTGCMITGAKCNGGGFTITLLYTNSSNSGVYYVENTTQSFTENTPVVGLEKAMPSYCIKDGSGICNYEDTLWAAAALAKTSSYNTAIYSPYLSISRNNNPVDNALLYNIVGGDSLINQITSSPNFNIVYPSTTFGTTSSSEGYWTSGYGDNYLSTGLIYWLVGSHLGSTKSSVENWFYGEQEPAGSWGFQSLRDTAIIYFALFNQPPSHILTSIPPSKLQFESPGGEVTLTNNNYVYANVSYLGINLKNITLSLYKSGTLVESHHTPNNPSSDYFGWNFTGLTSGVYSINATSFDKEGYLDKKSVKVEVSAVNPDSNIYFVSPPTPNAPAYLSQNFIPVRVNFTGIGLRNTTIYVYSLTRSQVLKNSTTTASLYQVNYTNLPPGTYYINATTYDLSNNINHTETRAITLIYGGIESSPYSNIHFLSPPTPNNSKTLQQDYIPVSIFFSGAGISSITSYLYNSSSLVGEKSSSSGDFLVNFNYANLPPGTYYINATSVDIYGNKNSTETRAITLTSASSGGGGTTTPQISCSDQGYYCLSAASCTQAGGNSLIDYSYTCPGLQICCSENLQLQSCANQQGQLCSSSQTCSGGSQISSSDATSSQICCLGTCTTPSQSTSTCDSLGGICRSSCSGNEGISSSGTCVSNSQVCCVANSVPVSSSNNIVLIVVLSVLVLLIILGIIFRNKLRILWMKIKSKMSKGRGRGGSKPSGPGRPPSMPPRGPPPRMPMRPRSGRPPIRNMSPRSRQSEDVLKKLKEMGK